MDIAIPTLTKALVTKSLEPSQNITLFLDAVQDTSMIFTLSRQSQPADKIDIAVFDISYAYSFSGILIFTEWDTYTKCIDITKPKKLFYVVDMNDYVLNKDDINRHKPIMFAASEDYSRTIGCGFVQEFRF